MLKDGAPLYQVSRSSREIIKASKLGFEFKDAAAMVQDLAVTGSRQSSFDEIWEQPWGEVKEIRNHYNELRVELEEKNGTSRKMDLVFRVYNDGIGFRYELPEQGTI